MVRTGWGWGLAEKVDLQIATNCSLISVLLGGALGPGRTGLGFNQRSRKGRRAKSGGKIPGPLLLSGTRALAVVLRE